MLRLSLLLYLFQPLWVLGESTKETDPWRVASLSAIQSYLSRPVNKILLKQCKGYLDMPSMLNINTSPTQIQLEGSMYYLDEAIESNYELQPDNVVIGYLLCGVGGGSVISVIFEKQAKKAIAIVNMPGR